MVSYKDNDVLSLSEFAVLILVVMEDGLVLMTGQASQTVTVLS